MMPYPSRSSSIKMINYSQLLLAKKKKNVQVIALILRGTARDKGKTNSRWFCLFLYTEWPGIAMEKPQKQELCHLASYSLAQLSISPRIKVANRCLDAVIHHAESRSTTFIVELKQEKLGGEIGFAFVDWQISIIRRIEILRDEISADRFPQASITPRDYTKHGRTKGKGEIVGPRFERFFPPFHPIERAAKLFPPWA